MHTTLRRTLSLIVAFGLIAIPTLVFAKELGSLTIGGPGIKGTMTLDHEGGMRKLEGSGFFDQTGTVKPPEGLGAGYNITASLNLDGKMTPFVQMVYYPAAKGPGYVHYTARLNGETLKPVDQWGLLNTDAEAAFRGLMGIYHIALQPAFDGAPVAVAPVLGVVKAESQSAAEVEAAQVPAQAQDQTAIPSVPIPSLPVGLALAAALLVVLGAGFVLKRRAVAQRNA